MHKRLKPLLALTLSLFMSVSTVSNVYSIHADDEVTQEETVDQDTNTEDVNEENQENNEQNVSEPAEENQDLQETETKEEQLGDSNMMDYFLVDQPVLYSGNTENFVLSLNDTEGYSDFKITVQKSDGTTFDLESDEQVDHLVKFSKVFNEEDKGEYSVTTLHYVYNDQPYYLNFSDLDMDVKFGVDQEYEGYDESLQDLTQDETDTSGVIEVTDVNQAEQQIVNGVASQPATMSMDEFSTRAATGPMTICIDPGHGGSDGGAYAFGSREADLTLKIAKYCKEELSKYDVNVVMTRTTDVRLGENAAYDLKNRVEVAKKAGASYFISIHLNSASNASAKGAEVYYPNTSSNANLSNNGQNLAKAIQSQLTALGLYDRGIKIRNYTDGSTSSNPNSSDQDYYGVIRYAKQANISGLIIEHCFLSNQDEYNKYLSTDAKLQQLGVADAKGIVSALGLQLKNDSLDNLADQNRNTLADGVYTISSVLNSNYVLDVSNGSIANGANIQLYQSNGTQAQSFKVTHDSQGYVTFTNVKSGKVLDVYNGSCKNGANVWQYNSNDSKAQKWIVRKEGNSYVIISALNSNYVLDLSNGNVKNGSNIQLNSYNGANAERWNITKYVSKEEQLNSLASQNAFALPDGTYTIRSAKNSNYVLDINGGNTWNGANIQLYASNGTPAQAFKVTHDSNGYVTITNVKSGKVLDVFNGTARNSQNVWQYSSNNTRAQKWIAKQSGSGYVLVSALNSNYVLDLYNGTVRSGGNIQLYQSNGTSAQQWIFDKFVTDRERCDSFASQNKSKMDDGVYFIKNLNVNYALDVYGGSLYAGGNVQLYSLNKTNAQKWKISHDSKGYVSFQNVGSGMYLTATGSGNGSNVNQQTQSNDYNQKWIIMFDNNQNLRIVSALNSNMVLDVSGGYIRNSSNIQLYESNNTAAQKWVFEYVNTNATGGLTQIMGTSQTSVNQMVRYYNANTSGYDTFKAKYNGKYNGSLAKGGASTITQFAQIYYEEATREGVRAEVAFAQCMKETGFLKYGGDVLPNQYNFAGIGATGAVHGASFANVRMGVRAQIQHLKAYASLTGLTQECVDPRFNLVKRGCAQYVEWLGKGENPNGYGWAVSKSYGHDIVNMVNVLLSK